MEKESNKDYMARVKSAAHASRNYLDVERQVVTRKVAYNYGKSTER